MRKRWTLLGLVGAGMVIGVAVAGDDEEKTSLDQVPAQVREALLKWAAGAAITKVEKETEHGMVFYEAEWGVNGRKAEAKVMANGDLVELEEKVDANNVPDKVKAAAAKEFPAGAEVKYEKLTLVVYEIEAKINGKEKEVRVLPTGKIIGREEEKADDDDNDGDDGENEEKISLDQVPAAVKATILAEAKGATIKEVERETENGQTVYEAEWVENGQEIEVKVAPDGKLLKREIEDQDDEDDDDK